MFGTYIKLGASSNFDMVIDVSDWATQWAHKIVYMDKK